MKDGVGVSPANKCKRLLELDGNEGKKSMGKYRKRESNRGITKMHYWVRDPSEKLSGVKCKSVKLPSGYRMNDLYHIHACKELGK